MTLGRNNKRIVDILPTFIAMFESKFFILLHYLKKVLCWNDLLPWNNFQLTAISSIMKIAGVTAVKYGLIFIGKWYRSPSSVDPSVLFCLVLTLGVLHRDHFLRFMAVEQVCRKRDCIFEHEYPRVPEDPANYNGTRRNEEETEVFRRKIWSH